MNATAAAPIRLEGVRKVYPDGTVAVTGLTLDVPAGEIVVLVGTVRLWQVHDPADGQPAGRADRRSDRARRRGRHPCQPGRIASSDGLRHPARRTVSTSDRPGQRGHRAPTVGLAAIAGRGTSRRAARPDRAGAGPVRRPVPARALRWAAATGRRGPGARRRSGGAAHGRAVLRGGPDRARPVAGRVPAAAGSGG